MSPSKNGFIKANGAVQHLSVGSFARGSAFPIKAIRLSTMQLAAVIIGTRHTFQVGGEDCPRGQAEEFHGLLLNAVRDWNLRGVAEEMSSDGLINYKASKSVPFSVATTLGLPYRACDPTLSQRTLAGIVGPGEVLIDAKMQGLSDDEAEQRLAVEEIKREGYWLRELQDQNVWPTLFVCGMNHVNRFKSLLDSAGLPAHVLVEDWVPKPDEPEPNRG